MINKNLQFEPFYLIEIFKNVFSQQFRENLISNKKLLLVN